MQRKKKERWKEKGSITIFLTLTMLLVLSFLFSLLEAARVYGLGSLTQQKMKVRLESAFGAYNRPLWEQYDLLFLDGGYGTSNFNLSLLEGHIMEEAQKEEGRGFLTMEMKSAEITQYALAADNGGAILRQQASQVIRQKCAEHLLKEAAQKLLEGISLYRESGSMEEKWRDAKEAIDQAKEGESEEQKEGDNVKGQETQREQEEGDAQGQENQEVTENPVSYVENLRRTGILGLVVENPGEISTKGRDTTQSVQNRERYCGNLPAKEEDIVDKVCFLQYLSGYFSCAGGAGAYQSGNHVLDYELEYCISGKKTDYENLEAVVNKLLAVRMSGNFISLLKSPQKQAQAYEVAAGIVGLVGAAPLIKPVQIGVLLAWSYVESIRDVRHLLSGGKVPLVKSEAEFQCELGSLHKVVDSWDQSSKQERGLDYRQYLMILLGILEEDTLSYRAMDVMEQNLRLYAGYGQVRIDAMIQSVKAVGTYQAPQLFWSMVMLAEKKTKGRNYVFDREQTFSYLIEGEAALPVK